MFKAENILNSKIVAIKQFKETNDDIEVKIRKVRKISMREIRLLTELRHQNIVNLLEVFKYKEKINMIFEYVPFTALELLEKSPKGLSPLMVKKIIFQLTLAIDFLHSMNVMHRDIKPENLLISKHGVLKLCDFGFARYQLMNNDALYTEYISTRWYRAPELIIGEVNYNYSIDIWALGCIVCELSNGQPLFPGKCDIEMITFILSTLGNYIEQKDYEAFIKNEFIGKCKVLFIRLAMLI